jgi:iron uptake system component EfeO
VPTRSHLSLGLGGTALIALLASACGGSSSGGSTPGASDQAALSSVAGSSASSGPTVLQVKLTNEGCAPAKLSAASGAVTFNVVNEDADAVTEIELKDAKGIIIGEKENVAAGLKGSFTLKVRPGTYVMSCPNGDKEDNGVLTVSGTDVVGMTKVTPEVAARATADYKGYVEREAAQLVTDTTAFVAALNAGDLAKAKSLFGPTRVHYETIEPIAESFGDLDPEIDARENDVEDLTKWTGFHKIEKILWDGKTTDGTSTLGAKLLADVKKLQTSIPALELQPAQLGNGAVELMNEVASSKITGEEDRYSHTDLSDFAANLAGARQAFDYLQPALAVQGESSLAASINTQFHAVAKTLDTYRRSTPLGYATYEELTAADRRTLTQAIDALAEPLSTIAAKVSA